TVALAKIGTGRQTLSGTDTYHGGTTISGGTLAISADANLGTVPASAMTNVTFDGGTLEATAALLLAVNRSIRIGLNGGTLQSSTAGQTLTVGGTIDGSAALMRSGAGGVTFAGLIGGSNPLASFTVNSGSGLTTLQQSTTISGAATFSASVSLAGTTLTA